MLELKIESLRSNIQTSRQNKLLYEEHIVTHERTVKRSVYNEEVTQISVLIRYNLNDYFFHL